MKTRRLGRQGPNVSEMGLGCMGMSEFYGRPDEAEAIATIHRALDLGMNFLDTADAYGPFTNEKLVGRAIADRRHDVVLATKFGIVRSTDPKYRGIDGSPAYVRKACQASLDRLGVVERRRAGVGAGGLPLEEEQRDATVAWRRNATSKSASSTTDTSPSTLRPARTASLTKPPSWARM